MIDNSTLMPLGVVLQQVKGGFAMFWAGYKKEGSPKIPAVLCQPDPHRFFVIPDVASRQYDIGNIYDPEILNTPRLKKAKKANFPTLLGSKTVKYAPIRETVVLLGGGLITEEELAQVKHLPRVAVNAGIRHGCDYFLTFDPTFCLALGLRTRNTHAHLGITCNPDIPRQHKWKSVSWFIPQHWNPEIKGHYRYFNTETITGHAIQFVFNTLKADKLILLGMQHPANNDIHQVYYWAGIQVQGICWWYSRAGKEIWSCTPGTSVQAGVKLGVLGEAIEPSNPDFGPWRASGVFRDIFR